MPTYWIEMDLIEIEAEDETEAENYFFNNFQDDECYMDCFRAVRPEHFQGVTKCVVNEDDPGVVTIHQITSKDE